MKIIANRHTLLERADRWSASEFVALDIAALWIASRCEATVGRYFSREDRGISWIKLRNREQDWLRHKVDGMAYSIDDTALEMEICLFSNVMTIIGKDSNKNTVEVPGCFWRELPQIDFPSNAATDLLIGRKYTDLTTSKCLLLERYEPRDAYAQRLFRRTVWDAKMAAHWVENRTSSGFYDVTRTRAYVETSQSLLDHLQSGKITAVVDGRVVGSNVWFPADVDALRRARFESQAVMELFRVDEDTSRIRRITEALNLLPDGTSKAAARKKIKESLGESGTTVNLLVDAESRFQSLPRGRPRKKPPEGR